MKKFIYLLAMAMVATAMVSCDKDDDKNGKGDEKPSSYYRIKSFTLTDAEETWADVYQYTFNDAGKVTKVFREETKQWNFTYSGNTITVKDAADAVVYTMTLGSNGYVATLVKGADTYKYSYNGNGQINKIEKNNEVVSNYVITDNCVVSWSRFTDGAEQPKVQTYIDRKNIGGIHTIYNDKAQPEERWIYETGLFGKASAYMCETSGWQSSAESATYSYEYDANGYPTKEIKDYPGWPEYFKFTWEKVEVK